MPVVLRRVVVYVVCSFLVATMGMALFGWMLIWPNTPSGQQGVPTGWIVAATSLWLAGLGIVVWNPLSSRHPT